MDLETNIRQLEQRYQVLTNDFRTGKIDESTFIAEVDRLQFQDNWGRYWMIGAQTGNWHYYDGQTWHQADPRAADQLPFMDDQGRYWQRGVKSGDWYYYQSDTGEWVKPGAGDELSPPQPGMQEQNAYSVPYSSHLYPQSSDTGPSAPSQLDAELFQDDEGRYWAMGRKTGQWYFYEQDGWHSADEFQPDLGSQTYFTQTYQPQAYQPPPGGQQEYASNQHYDAQPQQPQGYPPYAGQETPPPAGQQPTQAYVVHPQQSQQQPGSPSQPIQIYITSPQGQEGQAPAGQQRPAEEPAAPQAQPASQTEAQAEAPPRPAPPKPAGELPDNPPSDRSDSGSWYYFDGKQWLKYSTGEPDDAPPAPPGMVIEQEAKSQAEAPKAKAEPKKDEPVVAEVFDDDEPPVEVVDVEVITVLEPEPDPASKRAAPEPEPEPEHVDETASERRSMPDEIRPRRASRPVEVPSRGRRVPTDSESLPRRERSPSEPNRPVAPRKRESAHEPTIIIPTGATASNIAAPGSPSARRTKPVRPASGEQQRRARENTLPMERVQAPDQASSRAHRQMTQPMPRSSSAKARSDTVPMRVTKSAREAAQEKAASPPASPRQAAATKPEKSGHTVGDVLRSLPSTLWTFVGGVILLVACALGLIFTWGWMQGDDLNPPGLVAVPSLTPTLDAGPPDASPTPGPTPSAAAAEADTTATPVSLATFSSSALGYSLEYPEDWEQAEDELCGIFSPSEEGLTQESPEDAAIWICKSAESDAAISDLLSGVLEEFPTDAETLNEGTISIASQTWTSAQIRFEEESLGGQGIATLAVTSKEGAGYYLVALAPADQWNVVQPLFQAMINSFSFSTRTVAQAGAQESEETDQETDGEATPGASALSDDEEATEAKATPTPTEKPKGTATPLVYAIQSGDSLLTIANKFGVDVDLLASKNDIADPTALQIGQELVIPFTAEELERYNEGRPVAQADTGADAPASGSAEDEEEAEEDSGTSPGAAETEEGSAAGSAEAPAAAAAEAEEETEAAPVSGRIVYPAFNPGTDVYDVWMVDLASGEQNVVAAEASQPAFSKDGGSLAYRSWNLGTRGIFFRDFVGGRGGQVTRFIEDGLPTWAPDGFSFAFSSRREGDRVPRIFVGNQMGDEAYSVGFQGEYPATFPDGRLVVKGCTPSGDCGLYVMGATGGGEKKISSEVADTAPAVSPDGGKIAFMSSARGATNWEIWVMNADGSNPQRLTNNGSNEGLPAWSPDGQSIAYVSDQGGSWAVWAMNADGSNQRKLFNMKGSPDGKVLRDIDNSKGWLEERISWAP